MSKIKIKPSLKRKNSEWEIIPDDIPMAQDGRITLDEFRPKFTNSNQDITNNLKLKAQINSKGTQANPVNLPEVEISTVRDKPLGFAGQSLKSQQTNPYNVPASQVASQIFNFVPEAMHTPSRLVNYGIGAYKNKDLTFNPYQSEITETLGLQTDPTDLTHSVRNFALNYGADFLLPALPKTPKQAGTLFREQVYKAIDPVGYGAKEKILSSPKTWWKNTVYPEKRALEIGKQLSNLSPDYVNELERIGQNRLDAWRIGLKLDQKWNTFEQIGDNTYRIKNMFPEPGEFSSVYSDMLANQVKNESSGFYTGENPLVTIAKKHDKVSSPKISTKYGDYSINDMRRYLMKEGDNIKPWEQYRIVENAKNPEFQKSVYDADRQGIMGSFRWDIKKPNYPDYNIHFQSNDLWNLNPFEKRGAVLLDPSTEEQLTKHFFKPLQNLEALELVGGKPFNIQNNFIVDPKTYQVKKSFKQGGNIKTDPKGYWDKSNHGKPVRIPSNKITMKGVNQPLYGIDDTGFAQMMYPNQDYQFPGSSVVEIPLMQDGGKIEKWKKEMQDKGIPQELRNNAYVKEKSERAFRNIIPQSYGDLSTNLDRYNRYKKDLGRNKESLLWYAKGESDEGKIINENIYYKLPKRDDAFSLYLGLPQKNNSFGVSDYKPSKSSEDKVYLKPNYWTEGMKQSAIDRYFLLGDKDKVVTNERVGVFNFKLDSLKNAKVPWSNPESAEWFLDNPLGDFTMSKGKDEKGNYISLYDIWDLQPFSQGEGASSNKDGNSLIGYLKKFGKNVNEDTEISSIFGAGKPFEIYDRIYYDPQTKKVTQPKNTDILKKVDVSGNPKFINIQSPDIFKNGGFIPKMQQGGNVRPPIKGTKEQYQAYQDSLDLYKQSQKLSRIFPELPKVTKEEYDRLRFKSDGLPHYEFDEAQYQEDKKAHLQKDSFEDYIYSATNSSYFNHPRYKANEEYKVKFKKERDVNKYSHEGLEKFAITLKDGSIKEPQFLYDGKPDWDEYNIFSADMSTQRMYSKDYETGKPVLEHIHSGKIAPIRTDYFAKDSLINLGGINTSLSSTGWYQKGQKPVFKQISNKNFVNQFIPYESRDVYAKPVQPIIYQPEERRDLRNLQNNETWEQNPNGSWSAYQRPKEQPINIQSVKPDLLPLPDINMFNPIPFEKGTYFSRKRQSQEQSAKGKKDYFDKKTGKFLGTYKIGGKIKNSDWEIIN